MIKYFLILLILLSKKMLKHLLFNGMQLIRAYYKRMKRRAHINCQEIGHFTRLNNLSLHSDSRDSDAFCFRSYGSLFQIFFGFQYLLDSGLNIHKSGRIINHFIFNNILIASFLHPNIQQRKCVQSGLFILHYFFIKRVGSPFFGEIGDGDNFSEPVNLHARAADSIYNRCIMHHLHFNSELHCS